MPGELRYRQKYKKKTFFERNREGVTHTPFDFRTLQGGICTLLGDFFGFFEKKLSIRVASALGEIRQCFRVAAVIF